MVLKLHARGSFDAPPIDVVFLRRARGRRLEWRLLSTDIVPDRSSACGPSGTQTLLPQMSPPEVVRAMLFEYLDHKRRSYSAISHSAEVPPSSSGRGKSTA